GLAHVADFVESAPTAVDGDQSSGIERLLLGGLLGAVTQSDAAGGRITCCTTPSLDRIVHRALALLRTHDEQDLHVEYLCREIDVAERSLLRGFHKFF